MIVTHDAPTDDSLKQAIVLQRNSRHPVRIIDKQLNTGLADAPENLGLQLARAPYAFILDADNMVFPPALEQLHATSVGVSPQLLTRCSVGFKALTTMGKLLLSYYELGPTNVNRVSLHRCDGIVR